ncbi:MAG: hypothetical protein ABIF77_02900, partial [bacterium]
RVRAWSEDGHGVDLTVAVDEDGLAPAADSGTGRSAIGPIAVLGYLFGVFGIVILFVRKERS